MQPCWKAGRENACMWHFDRQFSTLMEWTSKYVHTLSSELRARYVMKVVESGLKSDLYAIPRDMWLKVLDIVPYVQWSDMFIYHTSNSWSQWGSSAAARSLQKVVFFTTTHMRIHIRYYKSHALHLNVQWGLYEKIINTIIPSYIGKISLVCCRWHCCLCCALVTIQKATNSWYFPV